MFTKVSLWKKIQRKFFKPEIYPEAFFAYFHKLPNELQVSWFRDDGMIVGRVNAGGKEFVTQGSDTNDFIRMVNESLITAFNIPENYFDVIKQARTYNPNPAERILLEDASIKQSTLGLVKTDRRLTLKLV